MSLYDVDFPPQPVPLEGITRKQPVPFEGITREIRKNLVWAIGLVAKKFERPKERYREVLGFLDCVGIIRWHGKKVGFLYSPENFPEDKEYNRLRKTLKMIQNKIWRLNQRINMRLIDRGEYEQRVEGIAKLVYKFACKEVP